MAKTFDEEHDEDFRPVFLPSGAPFSVHKNEEEYFIDRVRKYQEDLAFSNVSDLQDLDRVLIGELLCWRWGQWIMAQKNYWAEAVDESALQKQIKETSHELRMVKGTLGMDKVSRDRASGQDSVAHYLEQLPIRAKAFGYMRNDQFNRALEIFNQLRSLVTFHDGCDEDERRERHIQVDDILNWLREQAFPEYDEIDRKFRQEGNDPQKGWIREL